MLGLCRRMDMKAGRFHVKHDFKLQERMTRQALKWGIELPEEKTSSLVRFAVLLSTYAEANVIGARTIEEVVTEHVLDSLSCLKAGAVREARSLIDVGSGGGLPGVPLALVVDGLNVSLLEATAKKAKFLERAKRELGASNIAVSNERAENAGRAEEFRARYDVATARAVASLDVLAEYCLPLVRVGGSVVAMKGDLKKEELRRGEVAARTLGAEVSDLIEVPRLPEYEQKRRCLVVLTKTSQTPGKYPRKTGTPAKNPLGGGEKR